MEKMSFVSRETANAANIFNDMLSDKDCTIFFNSSGLYFCGWLYEYL
jgi:deoxyhypusine synthase